MQFDPIDFKLDAVTGLPIPPVFRVFLGGEKDRTVEMEREPLLLSEDYCLLKREIATVAVDRGVFKVTAAVMVPMGVTKYNRGTLSFVWIPQALQWLNDAMDFRNKGGT